MIDAHVHFYDRRRLNGPWVWPPAGHSLSGFGGMPGDYLHDTRPWDIDGVIAVEASRRRDDMTWLLHLGSQSAWIRGVIGYVDPASSSSLRDIAIFAEHPLFRGIRLYGSHFVSDAQVLSQRVLPHLAETQLVLEILSGPDELAAVAQRLSENARLKVVINHLGQPWQVAPDKRSAWLTSMHRLSRLPLVYCKLSGLEAVHAMKHDDARGWIRTAFQAIWINFGPHRIMFGSNWPAHRTTYSFCQMMALATNWLARLAPQSHQQVTRDNAVAFYRLHTAAVATRHEPAAIDSKLNA